MGLTDDKLWDLPGARTDLALPGHGSVCESSLVDLLRAVAVRLPRAAALVGLDGATTYADLLRQAETVAGAIAARVPPGRPVACVVRHTAAGIAGIIGCLIAARPCIVLNPAEPVSRLAMLLEDARPAAVLLSGPLGFPLSAPTLLLDDVLAGPMAAWKPSQAWNPDAPASVHYTSGSSGRPKGIILSARSILYRALDAAATWGLTAADAVLVTALPATGAGLSFLLAMLYAGSRYLLADIGTQGISAVLRLAAQEEVTCAAAGPALWRAMLQVEAAPRAFRSLRVFRVGNAALSRADLATWRRVLPPDCVVLHTYASTEALVIAQWFVATEVPGDAPTLAAGLLQPNLDYALLDEAGRPASPGAAGELLLRGPLLALGEWQEGRLVSGRLPPLFDRPGWRSFRTGDMAKVDADGMLRLLGRSDRQVKINGVRVEPGELEAVLRAEPDVVEAAVVAVTRPDKVMLHGFITAPGVAQAALLARLRHRLTASLPSALRPTRLVVLEAIPLLPGGKVDYGALLELAERS